MSSDDFLAYFQRSRSLSEAVKGIVRDYPTYREVSIYARARRLQCKFDSKGRFYQPSSSKKLKREQVEDSDAGRGEERERRRSKRRRGR